MSLPLHLRGIASPVRRLSRKGWSAAAIASAYHLARADVRAILSPAPPLPSAPPPRRPRRARRIWSHLAGKVRRLHARGEPAGRIAELLGLDPAEVASYV